MSEKSRYIDGLRAKFARGLQVAKFFPAPGAHTSTEELYAELNRMDTAHDRPDPDVLGKFSPKA